MPKDAGYQGNSVSYETVAKAFSEEASSFLSGSVLGQVLGQEKIRFENAALLQISPKKLVGNNTARYCKDLLRRQQPFPFLYFFLCFLTEISVWLVPYGVFIEICQHLAAKRGSSFSVPFLYGVFLIIGLVAGNTLFRLYRQKLLGTPVVWEASQVKKAQKSITRFGWVLSAGIAVLVGLAILLAANLGWDKAFSLRLPACFTLYISCILLFGIHNIIYSSHCLSFFMVGILLLARRPKQEVEAAAQQYMRMRYLQMFGASHKTWGDLEKDKALETRLRQSLHSHMAAQRVYDVLALVILVALDVVCIRQLCVNAVLPLICFFAILVLCTCVFLLALASANHILQCTR